ncbi:MAG: fibronectin type III domain-containing protein, partial [Clostridium sp.]
MISNENYNPVFLAGDVNNDFVIDMKDYKLVFDAIGSKDSKYDLNRDGSVDIADLSYVNSNIGKTKGQVEIVDLEKILDPENIDIDTKDLKGAENIKDILTSADTVVNLGRADGEAPSADKPLTISMGLDTTKNGTLRTANSEGVEMESVVIKGSAVEGEDASIPSQGYITYTDVDGNTETVPFNEENLKRSGASNDVVIDLGSQVAVKQISINVTGNRGNKKISQIAKIEFLNNVYKEVPKPDMNIPTIKSLETSTNLHDERITISWEPQANVTSYEVMYQKLNESGQVISTKKLQTNKTNLNILDKDIKPYDLYRVSIQSLNGEWSSGYLNEDDVPSAFDGKADNVDADFNPIDSYYNGDKGSVSEIQVIPLNSPEPPRNLTTNQGYKSFTVSWEQHPQARDFDIYYRKLGDSNKNWIKANDNHKEVTEGSQD